MWYELEILPGLIDFAEQELKSLAPHQTIYANQEGDALRFKWSGSPLDILKLRTVVAAYRVEYFDVPRPKALLGHQYLEQLLAAIERVRSYTPFASFRFAAAGKDSGVFRRLAEMIEQATALIHQPEDGEMLLRVRPVSDGWEVLVRLSPKPLSARDWRVANMAGGLNATVAVAMLTLGELHPQDRLFNAMSGSGTLLIEARVLGHRGLALGLDRDPAAMAIAQQNVQASGYRNIELLQSDVLTWNWTEAPFDCVVTDVPWGDAIGSSAENRELYPQLLLKMAEVTHKKSRLVVLTHEMKLFDGVLDQQSQWKVKTVHKVYHGGHYPRMYVLTRT